MRSDASKLAGTEEYPGEKCQTKEREDARAKDLSGHRPVSLGNAGVRRLRAPRSAPIPASAVLSIGPTGLDSVFTATAAATMNPTAVPSAVPQNWVGVIQRRHVAMRATTAAAIRPPITPPAQRPPRPVAFPKIEPSAPPSPVSREAATKR
jgi:hypothetical protein